MKSESQRRILISNRKLIQVHVSAPSVLVRIKWYIYGAGYFYASIPTFIVLTTTINKKFLSNMLVVECFHNTKFSDKLSLFAIFVIFVQQLKHGWKLGRATNQPHL